ncbi:MAG: N-acetylmuramoyl-L-alanine amidase [Vicinamibacterales bacterium]
MLPRRTTLAIVGVLVSVTGLVWTSAIAQEPVPYQVVTADGIRPLPVARRSGSTDFIALDLLPRFFDVTMREDSRADGIVISAGAQRVVLTAGQATVSAGGRLVSLSAPVTKDGSKWLVPVDFLRVLDPVLNRRIEIRREARLIVIDASVPRIGPRFERTPGGGRLTISVDPGLPARVTRAGNLVTLRFQADALDATALADAPAEFVASVKATGPSLVVELGPSVIDVRQDEQRDASRITFDLIATNTPAPARPEATNAPVVAPTFERQGAIRTIVIDPGHGGADVGTRNAAGLEEKDITLATAQRLKATLESQLGVRAILTRETDTSVSIDPRAAIANNNKADLFISLHVNSSQMPLMRGWQIQSLDPADYSTLLTKEPGTAPVAQWVPIVGGGSRMIDVVPWQLAQIPHARQSISLSELLSARLAEAGLPPQLVPMLQTPARVLVGANMPAVLIELGFISNAEDAAELGSRAYQGKLAEVITSVVNGLRAGWPGETPGGRVVKPGAGGSQ